MQQTSNKEPLSLKARVEGAEVERRQVLSTIGRFVYAAPALALLAQPKASQAGYGGGGSRPGYGHKKKVKFKKRTHKRSRRLRV